MNSIQKYFERFETVSQPNLNPENKLEVKGGIAKVIPPKPFTWMLEWGTGLDHNTKKITDDQRDIIDFLIPPTHPEYESRAFRLNGVSGYITLKKIINLG